MHKKYLLFLSLCLIFLTSYGISKEPKNDSAKKDIKTSDKSSLTFPQGEKTLLNEIIVIEPIKDHVFNLEAPNSCSKGRLIFKSESKIKCQTHAGENIFEVYVCDEKKTYCKTEKHKVVAENPSGLWSWIQYHWKKNLNYSSWKAPKHTGVSNNVAARNFIHNDIDKALKLARSEKKTYTSFCHTTCMSSLSTGQRNDFGIRLISNAYERLC